MSGIDVNKCPVFVSSADSYSDIWPLFFAIFRREWPEYRGTIYLNTQEKGYSFDGLDIVCTKVGPQRYFGETFLSGVRQVKDDHFLLMMIDYFFEGRVNVQDLQNMYVDFLSLKPDAAQIIQHPFKSTAAVGTSGHFRRILPPGGNRCAWVSFQMAFWRKSAVPKYIKPWESPWIAEHFGTNRAEILNPEIWTSDIMPIPYDAAGVLHGGGKWYRKTLMKINFGDLPEPRYSDRGYFVQPKNFVEVQLQRAKRLCHWIVLRSVFDVIKLRLQRVYK